MQHLLLSVVGNTPQVVTETLYAIHAQGKPWPSQIKIITTTIGKRGAMRLLDEHILASLCDELGVACPAFGEGDILVVPDANGQPVADARTLDDHEALANFIVTEVRKLTDDDNPENLERYIHASLAGGRKTMTFYLGYAMSLFGRAGDCLSHVLVSADFENQPNFFYPTRRGRPLYTADKREINPADAIVELADIPFIRHRQNLPTLLKTPSTDKVNFRELINWINLGENPGELRVRLHTRETRLEVSDASGKLTKSIHPGLLEFAFYRMLAVATLAGETDIVRPGNKEGDRSLSKLYCDELLLTNQLSAGDTLAQSIDALRQWNVMPNVIRESTFKSLEQGIKASWFDQRINNLKSTLEKQLPHAVISHLLPRNIWDETGQRIEEGKTVKSSGYGIPLTEKQIHIL